MLSSCVFLPRKLEASATYLSTGHLLTEILLKGTRYDGTPENFDDKRVKTLENAVEVKSCGW